MLRAPAAGEKLAAMAACPKCKTDVSPDAKFCANCGRPTGKPGVLAQIAAGVFLFAVVVIAVQTCSGGGDSVDTATPTTSQVTPDTRPAPAPAPVRTFADDLKEAKTLADAIAVAKPLMRDSADATGNLGMIALLVWAQEHMRWRDAFVAKDETTIRLAKKDSASARGKRMCYSGRIVQIAKAPDDDYYAGILSTSSFDIINFFAVGSTGSLVEDNRARFCGVFTGLYTYSNAAGGTSHSVQMVGMFKLPENLQAE